MLSTLNLRHIDVQAQGQGYHTDFVSKSTVLVSSTEYTSINRVEHCHQLARTDALFPILPVIFARALSLCPNSGCEHVEAFPSVVSKRRCACILPRACGRIRIADPFRHHLDPNRLENTDIRSVAAWQHGMVTPQKNPHATAQYTTRNPHTFTMHFPCSMR